MTNVWLNKKNVVLIGDFNCDLLINSGNNESNLGRRLKNIIHSFSLTNVINSPTRISDHSES